MKGHKGIFAESLHEMNIPIKVCNCKYQRCHGLFVPSRPNQEYCLFEIYRQQGIIIR